MSQRVVTRYSLPFRQQVVAEIESGRFASIHAAQVHYEIRGNKTVYGWVRRMGKNHLLPKRVRVEPVDEADRVRELQKQVENLERLLGRTQAENLLNQSYLKIACEQLGVEVESFRKKSAGVRSGRPSRKG